MWHVPFSPLSIPELCSMRCWLGVILAPPTTAPASLSTLPWWYTRWGGAAVKTSHYEMHQRGSRYCNAPPPPIKNTQKKLSRMELGVHDALYIRIIYNYYIGFCWKVLKHSVFPSCDRTWYGTVGSMTPGRDLHFPPSGTSCQRCFVRRPRLVDLPPSQLPCLAPAKISWSCHHIWTNSAQTTPHIPNILLCSHHCVCTSVSVCCVNHQFSGLILQASRATRVL
jgi:hypothetical protein